MKKKGKAKADPSPPTKSTASKLDTEEEAKNKRSMQ